jgi:hypothetical protein
MIAAAARSWTRCISRISTSVKPAAAKAERHLFLTDLARSGWELHQIGTFAGLPTEAPS